MKCFHLIAFSVLCSVAFSAPEKKILRVPTHGNWQGQPIGLWKATRITHQNIEKGTPKKSNVWKAMLLGEDKNKNTIVVCGQVDEKGMYIKANPTTVSGAWSNDNPPPVPEETKDGVITIGDKDFPVLIKRFGPKADRSSGATVTETIWELKARPGFVLKRDRTLTDSFEDETYEHSIREEIVSTGQTNMLGKNVRFFRVRHLERIDGLITSRLEQTKSDELPEQGLIHSSQTWYDEKGKAKSTTKIELVAFGYSPEQAAKHEAFRRSRSYARQSVSLDSEAGKVNVVHLMRQGMPLDVAQEIVATRISVEDLEYGRKKAMEIDKVGKSYREDPSEENRSRLFKELQYLGSNNIGYIEPSLEKVLLGISNSDDLELRITALSGLTGYVSVHYAPLLAKTLIQEKQYTNQLALRMLSSTRWGDPRHVLSQRGVSLKDLPILLIPHAPDNFAVPELISRFEVGDKFQKSEVLELLGYYSRPQVRSLFIRLANEVVPDDFQWGKTDRSYLLKHIIVAFADLNIEGAPELFLKWMEWNETADGGTADKPENVMMRTVIDITLMTYGVRLRDDRVSAMIANKIKAGSAALSLLMTKNHLEKIGTFNLNMTPKKMESLLSMKLPSMFSEKKLKDEQLYGLLRLFKFSVDEDNFGYIMSKLMPDWKVDIDYAAIAQVQSKDWYTERKGIEPLKVREMHPEILGDILPYFGDKGVQVLIQLCGHPDFRRYMVPALAKVSHRRQEARDFLAAIRPQNDDEKFHIGLTLWCLGEDSRRKEYEKYLYFEPGHGKAGKVRRAVAYLPFDTLYSLIQQLQNQKSDELFRSWASRALSHHTNRKSAEFIMALWEGEVISRRNPEYGELFNRMAGRNFGMDLDKIQKWIQTLPLE